MGVGFSGAGPDGFRRVPVGLPIIVTPLPPALSYCVVNTNGRELLLACLDAIDRTHPAGVEREVLVLDNASDDGSAAAVRARGGDAVLIERERRTGKAENDSTLMQQAKGEYCLLLNEDSELRPGRDCGAARGARTRPESEGEVTPPIRELAQ